MSFGYEGSSIHTRAYTVTYMHIHIHIHIFTRTHTPDVFRVRGLINTHICIYTYVHIHTYIHIFTHTHTVHVFRVRGLINIHIRMCVFLKSHTHTHTHTHSQQTSFEYEGSSVAAISPHMYIPKITHTHTHTQTHTQHISFEYEGSSITAISPAFAPASGGAVITLYGHDFADVRHASAPLEALIITPANRMASVGGYVFLENVSPASLLWVSFRIFVGLF